MISEMCISLEHSGPENFNVIQQQTQQLSSKKSNDIRLNSFRLTNQPTEAYILG